MPDEIKKYNWIDPTLIPENDDILIVLVDDRQGGMGWFIKSHESGNYNHAMIMRKTGFLVSQANVLKEIPVNVYMKSATFLKFWKVKGLTTEEKTQMNSFMTKHLGSWYDYLGLFGQAVNLWGWKPFEWLTTPGLYFCSELVSRVLRISKNFSWLESSPSPVELNVLFGKHPEQFEVVGYWFND
jgi:hypothetical protein